MSTGTRLRIGITLGDPEGIGPEITAKALSALKRIPAHFTVIGDSSFSATRHRSTAAGGRASIAFLDEALRLLREKKIDCLVTCPISKESLHLAGFGYRGHTEYFAAKSGARNPVMMLLNGALRISLVTRHIPLKDVPEKITASVLKATIETSVDALKRMFGVRRPRVVVCGVNPHASDNGVIGNEEKKVVIPLLERLRRRVPCLDGPFSADVAVYRAARGGYDCVIAMYHDQALIPLKLQGNEAGVNCTLGLPFVRTSPLHGTAFDIAGSGRADPSSLIAAIRCARTCTLNLKNR